MVKGSAPGLAAVFAAVAALTFGCTEQLADGDDPRADMGNPSLVKLGAGIYLRQCALCHGAKLEGQPDWRTRRANGRLPAPPHDESGHTWHHPDYVLFGITRNGLVPPYAPKGYESDMPAFAGKLSDADIWAVLAYLKSRWTSPELREARAEMLRQVKRR